jgi:hypothetical protein
VAAFAATLFDYLSDSPGDGFGDLVVLDDYYGDAFFGRGHV